MHGRARQHRPQPGGEVSDQLGFVSEVGVFCDAGAKRAVLTAFADVLGDRRSLAASGFFFVGRARMSASAVSPVCGRRNEREHPAKVRAAPAITEAECGSEWSGRKAGESAVGRGRNSAEAVSLRSGRTASLGASRSRWATRGASAQGSARASVRSVTPGCRRFQIEERSDEASTILPR